MPKFSPIKWKKFEKFLLYVGCVFKRQKGDHRIYWRKDLKRPIVLPMYDNLPKFIILKLQSLFFFLSYQSWGFWGKIGKYG